MTTTPNINLDAVVAFATLRAAQHDLHKANNERHSLCEFCELESELASAEWRQQVNEAAEAKEESLRQHNDFHGEDQHGPHSECEHCVPAELELSAEELLREHRGW